MVKAERGIETFKISFHALQRFQERFGIDKEAAVIKSKEILEKGIWQNIEIVNRKKRKRHKTYNIWLDNIKIVFDVDDKVIKTVMERTQGENL